MTNGTKAANGKESNLMGPKTTEPKAKAKHSKPNKRQQINRNQMIHNKQSNHTSENKRTITSQFKLTQPEQSNVNQIKLRGVVFQKLLGG
jgi:hypothetical protein